MTKENETDKTTDSLAIQNKIAIVVDPNLSGVRSPTDVRSSPPV